MVYKNVLFFCIIFATWKLCPELLIIKKENNIFEPLSDQDIKHDGQRLSEILLKYQWPTCTAYDLTPDEQNELLTPDKANAEELFVQKKVQEINNKYHVIFIPTTLYQLFCLLVLFEKGNCDNPLQVILKNDPDDRDNQLYGIDYSHLLNQQSDPFTIRKKINDIFMKVNRFYIDGKDRFTYHKYRFVQSRNALLFCNQYVIKLLLKRYAPLKKMSTGLDFSHALRGETEALIAFLTTKLSKVENEKMLDAPYFIASLSRKKNTNIINKAIALEYEARRSNKGLLFRGTSLIQMPMALAKKPEEKWVLGSTVMRVDYWDQNERKFQNLDYSKPYSISFGSSLFGGLVRDTGACAYCYMHGNPDSDDDSDEESQDETEGRPASYALSVDKKAYFQHQCHNLFFIPPLCSLAALFQDGTLFHPRTKAAILRKAGNSIYVEGGLRELKDPTGFILITRDPVYHAELFSKYLAENAHIITMGNENDLSIPEKAFLELIKQSHQNLARYYQATRTLETKIKQIKRKNTPLSKLFKEFVKTMNGLYITKKLKT